MNYSKHERIQEVFRRLSAAPAIGSFDEAFQLVAETINAVEDDLTSIPYDPKRWQTDGRMYPPQMDNARAVPGRDDVTRFRSRGHSTLIANNGAIEIRDLDGTLIFQKSGADGKGI